MERRVAEPDLAGIARIGAENAAGDFGAAGADEPGHADDFAGVDLKGDIGENADAREVFDIQQRQAAGRARGV